MKEISTVLRIQVSLRALETTMEMDDKIVGLSNVKQDPVLMLKVVLGNMVLSSGSILALP